MSHVFISYVREDSKIVDRLCNSLRERGIQFWIDRNNILPGTRWKRAIRKAINDGDFFVACFSPHYFNRAASFMNEELTIAIELLRKMPIERAWFIPVLLAECEVPDREIGAGETLQDLQQVRLYEDWQGGIRRILSVIKPDDKLNTNILSILFLAANPSDTSHLRLDEELREIQTVIVESDIRDRFTLEVGMAVRLADLESALLRVKPRIVHFTGHGSHSGELILESEGRKSRHVSSTELISLFEPMADMVDCVILNVSFSAETARLLTEYIKYAIGMNGPVSDRAAIVFSKAFYLGLSYGRSIDDSFKLGCAAIALEGLPGQDTPVLYSRKKN